MSSLLFRILGLVFLVWVFQRLLSFLGGTKKSDKGKKKAAEPSTHMVKDPVCGMYMDSRVAVRLHDKSEELFFCSEECKKKYMQESAESGAAESAASR